MNNLDPLTARTIPELVRSAKALAQSLDFDGSCSDAFGNLLQVLAANASHVLEIGTGTGVGTAWMLSALRDTAQITTVEIDRDRYESASQLLEGQAHVHFGTFDELLSIEQFDLVFVDVGPLKDDGTEVIQRLRPGTLIVLDDFTPWWAKDDEWRARADPRRDFWLDHPGLASTEVLLTTLTSAILATVR